MIGKIVLSLLFGYLLGSVPWALIIGKVFYKTDVREYGSGNLGATNAGRTLGLPAFIMVTIMDALKGFIAFRLLQNRDINLAAIAALGVFIGHCYPLFAGFRGGKGVACSAGVLLAIALSGDTRYFLLQFGIPFATLVAVVLITRHMSSGSMLAFISAVIIAWLYNENTAIRLCLTVLCILTILKHHANIRRLINHQESKLF